jgi:hypothetical protein
MAGAYPNILLVGSDPDGSLLGEMLTHYAAVTRVEGIPEALANLETKDYDQESVGRGRKLGGVENGERFDR